MAVDIDKVTSSLEEIDSAFKDLHLHSADTGQASKAITVLADASKWNTSTRQQLGDQIFLKTLVEIIDCSLNDSLETVDVALRCIGNACINNNAAREAVTKKGFSWAVRCLITGSPDDAATPTLTAKVLYNICSDFEPAQQQCLREHVHYELIHLLTLQPTIQNEDKTLFIELLFWICSHKQPDSTTHDPVPNNQLTMLLLLPGYYQQALDPEDFAMLLETCLLYLRDAQVQRDVVEHKQVSRLWRMLKINEEKIASVGEDDDDAKLLVPLSTSLIWCLSDMAASPEFVRMYDLKNMWIQGDVIYTIKSASALQSPRLVTAVCQLVGNLLWSLSEPESFAYLIATDSLQASVIGMILISQDGELLHSACGVLIQLSRPSRQVREIICSDENLSVALERLCRHETPQLKQDGIKLLRALGKDSPAIQERFADLAKEIMSSGPSSDTAMGEVAD